MFSGDQRFLSANVDQPETESFESAATANAIGEDNHMAVEESLTFAVAHVCAIRTNGVRRPFVAGESRCIRMIDYLLFDEL